MNVAKIEFINKLKNTVWIDGIMLDGNHTLQSYYTISLNSFVRVTRVLIRILGNYEFINQDWNDEMNYKI